MAGAIRYNLSLSEIMELCTRYGVSSYQDADLKISFHERSSVYTNQAVESTEGGKPEAEESRRPSLDELFIEDPEAYEEALLQARDNK